MGQSQAHLCRALQNFKERQGCHRWMHRKYGCSEQWSHDFDRATRCLASLQCVDHLVMDPPNAGQASQRIEDLEAVVQTYIHIRQYVSGGQGAHRVTLDERRIKPQVIVAQMRNQLCSQLPSPEGMFRHASGDINGTDMALMIYAHREWSQERTQQYRTTTPSEKASLDSIYLPWH